MKNSQYFCPILLPDKSVYYQNNNEYFYLRQPNFQTLKISSHLKKNHIDSLNYRKIIGCRKNMLSIFVALQTLYNTNFQM
jgi:hypothetical protein